MPSAKKAHSFQYKQAENLFFQYLQLENPYSTKSLSSGAKIDFHFLRAKGFAKTLKMKRLLI